MSVRPSRKVNGSSSTPNQNLQLAWDTGSWRPRRRMPLCTLGKTLTTGKTTSEFNIKDMNEIQVDIYFSWGPDSEAA